MNRKGSEFLDVGGSFFQKAAGRGGAGESGALEGREGGLYKGGVLIIQKAHHKTSIFEVCDAPSDVCWRPQADKNYIDNILILHNFYKHFFL